MITALAAVLLVSAAGAAPAPLASPPPAVQASTVPAGAAALALGVSTYTVSTLYTGDRGSGRDPFLPPSMGGAARPSEHNAPPAVDIHALQLHGIMKDAKSDFALFSTEDGKTLVLRDGRLFDGRNKRIPGITGRIRIKQKRAELITADKDVQIYSFGESDDDKDKNADKPKDKSSDAPDAY